VLPSSFVICASSFLLPVKLIEVPAPDFDLEKTLNSGQVFHWQKHESGFVGTVGDIPVYVEQYRNVLRICSPKLDGLTPSSSQDNIADKPDSLDDTVARYFALDHPLRKICGSFPRDRAMNAARDYCRGLRIIRQQKWECLATFICSSMKQVAHIRQISHALRQRFGTRKTIFGTHVHVFPSAGRIAQSSERELRSCALGYRAKNLLETARHIGSGEANLEKWTALPDDELRAQLCELPGVGPKVANCVMLFAYERLRAFPIDVWIERVLREKYFARKRKPTSRKLRHFVEEYFGEHGGYAQQYLFHHARTTRRSGGRRAVRASASCHVERNSLPAVAGDISY
jgi:N-glycosylase/DNA lyase